MIPHGITGLERVKCVKTCYLAALGMLPPVSSPQKTGKRKLSN
jgi:hypothetical protein